MYEQQQQSITSLTASCSGCQTARTNDPTAQRCPDCGSLLCAANNMALPKGTVLATNYEILEELGVGAWGAVYRAKQLSMGRDVAVKVLHQHLTDKSTNILRFKQEAVSLQELTHEGIAAVYDIGTLEGGQPFIVQEFVTGGSLRDLVKCGHKFTGEEFKAIFIRILEVLEQAHGKNIVHRDIKPANIMISGDLAQPQIKLLDFGIAKLLDKKDAPALTGTGDVMGTPLYMSPEQCVADPVDNRSDLYSIGCMMYEFVAGATPFKADSSFEVMMLHLDTPAPDLRQNGIDPAYAEMIARCLAKRPTERFQSAEELRLAVQDLPESFGEGDFTIIPKASPASKKLIGAILASVALAALASAWAINSHFGSMTPKVAPINRTTAPLIESLLDEEVAVLAKDELQPGFRSANAPMPASSARLTVVLEQNGKTTVSQINSEGRLQSNLCQPQSAVSAVAFNPSTRLCFALDDKLKLVKLDPATGAITQVKLPAGMQEQASGITFDQSGKSLYLLNDSLWRFDLDKGTWTKVGAMPSGGAGFTNAGPDGGFYILGGNSAIPGHIRTLHKFDSTGIHLKTVNLSHPILISNGTQFIQLDYESGQVVATIPQPPENGQAKPPIQVVMQPESGKILRVCAISVK